MLVVLQLHAATLLSTSTSGSRTLSCQSDRICTYLSLDCRCLIPAVLFGEDIGQEAILVPSIFTPMVFYIHFKGDNQKPISVFAIMITFSFFFSLFLQRKIDMFSRQALWNIAQMLRKVQPDKHAAKALLLISKTVKTFHKIRDQCTLHGLPLRMQSKYRTKRWKESRKESWGHEHRKVSLDAVGFSFFFFYNFLSFYDFVTIHQES